ncbi:C39 family peptidase, partial [Achromobacter sp. Marseille-Q0513]|uniref:cysteine peptidase family C39 domain-containing protein n=1 Tax=Achromobacter sp. Marseille-Q0513 TaxID=2829161 RepID=UPI001B9869C1
ATMTNAALAELDNNTLNPKRHLDIIEALAKIDQLGPEQEDALLRRLKQAHAEGTQEAMDQMKSVMGPVGIQQTRDALQALLTEQSACSQVPVCAMHIKNSIKELDTLLTAYKTQSELTPKVDGALMMFDLATGIGAIRGPVLDAIRMAAVRASGGSLEMAVAKSAIGDGVPWAVRNGEVLATDGSVLARQNPLTGKYDPILEKGPFGSGNGGGAGGNPLLKDSIPRNTDRLLVDQGLVPTCGHNSCGMVLSTLGKDVDIGTLINRAPPTERGITSGRVVALMASEGVPASAYRMRNVDDLARYTSNGTPVIVRIVDSSGKTDFSHFVVVDGVTTRNGRKVVAIRDPQSNGQYFSPVETFAKNFTGDVVVPRSAFK